MPHGLRLLAGSFAVTMIAALASWLMVKTLAPYGVATQAIAVVAVSTQAVICLLGLAIVSRRWPADRSTAVAAGLSGPVLLGLLGLLGGQAPLWFGLVTFATLVGSAFVGLRSGSNLART